jgi:hypothetical protein
VLSLISDKLEYIDGVVVEVAINGLVIDSYHDLRPPVWETALLIKRPLQSSLRLIPSNVEWFSAAWSGDAQLSGAALTLDCSSKHPANQGRAYSLMNKRRKSSN